MALSPQKFREIVFQSLYSYDFVQLEEEELVPFFMKLSCVPRSVLGLVNERKKAIWSHKEDVDRRIAKASLAYDFHRIPKVELNILRLGVFELLYDEKIPPKVAIAEAIRLCRKFATAEGATFINAVLDHIYTEHETSLRKTP